GELQLLGNLAIGEPLPLAQQDRAALVLRHRLERVLEPDQLVRAPVVLRRDDLLQHLEVVRALDPAATPRGAAARKADVLGDLEQPRLLGFGHDAPLQAAEGVHERRLDGVLRLLARAQLVDAVVVDLPRVALVERTRGVRLGCDNGPGLDSGCTTSVGYCGPCLLPPGRGRTEAVSVCDGFT